MAFIEFMEPQGRWFRFRSGFQPVCHGRKRPLFVEKRRKGGLVGGYTREIAPESGTLGHVRDSRGSGNRKRGTVKNCQKRSSDGGGKGC